MDRRYLFQDGLFLITESPEMVKNYPSTVLTPNAVEFQRLFEKMVRFMSSCLLSVCCPVFPLSVFF